MDEGQPGFPVCSAFNDESIYYNRRREDVMKYRMGRRGDSLIAPFQCEGCWFVNLHGRAPVVGNYSDTQKQRVIRRANLDLFWSREAGTVRNVVGSIKDVVRRSKDQGWLRPPLEPMTPWPLADGEGMGVAILMLEKSLEPGRNSKTYQQFDTVRKLRSAVSNVYGATARGCKEPLALKSLRGEVQHLYQGSMQSVFMERFTLGMRIRMPEITIQSLPLMGSAVAELLNRLEAEWINPGTDPTRKRLITMVCGYIVVTFGYSLRGHEGFWTDAGRLCEGIGTGRNPAVGERRHVLVSLLGRFKGEQGSRMHVFPLSDRTSSGIRIRLWLERVVKILEDERKRNCPAFCDGEGYQLTERMVEEVIHPVLQDMQGDASLRGMIAKGVKVVEFYRCFRSFRRGAENTAMNNGVSQSTIELVHRWTKFERSRGKQPKSFSMFEHYASGEQTRPLQLSFSANL